jgi:hypothetical protein
MAHQDLPFDLLRKQLPAEVEKDCELPPSVLFALDQAWSDHVKLPGLSLAVVDIETSFAPMTLALRMIEEREGIVGTLSYNLIQYDTDSMAEFTKHLAVILEEVSIHPERRILDILTAQEKQEEDVGIASITQSATVAEDGFRFE